MHFYHGNSDARVCVSADRDAAGLLPFTIHHCQSVRDGVAARAQVSDPHTCTLTYLFKREHTLTFIALFFLTRLFINITTQPTILQFRKCIIFKWCP